MKLNTKFSINDKVWYFHPGTEKAVEGRVIEIIISIRSNPQYKPSTKNRSLVNKGEFEVKKPVVFRYVVTGFSGGVLTENKIFESKELLVENIKRSADKL